MKIFLLLKKTKKKNCLKVENHPAGLKLLITVFQIRFRMDPVFSPIRILNIRFWINPYYLLQFNQKVLTIVKNKIHHFYKTSSLFKFFSIQEFFNNYLRSRLCSLIRNLNEIGQCKTECVI